LRSCRIGFGKDIVLRNTVYSKKCYRSSAAAAHTTSYSCNLASSTGSHDCLEKHRGSSV